MATISSIGSSGLQAAQLRLDASANNVANMNTPNYRRQVVAQEEAADSAGVRATVQRQQEAEGVALEKEAVEPMSATDAGHSSSAYWPNRGKCSRTDGTQSGAPFGSRFWNTFSPASPSGNRCSMVGRCRSARRL